MSDVLGAVEAGGISSPREPKVESHGKKHEAQRIHADRPEDEGISQGDWADHAKRQTDFCSGPAVRRENAAPKWMPVGYSRSSEDNRKLPSGSPPMTSCTASGAKLIDGLKRNPPSGRRCTRAVRRGGGGHGKGLKVENLLEYQRFTDGSGLGEESNHPN